MTSHVIIIGAYGSAGVAVAQELATDDEIELTLIDDGDPGGGLCILRGCMPSKAVFASGAHTYHARRDDSVSGDPDPNIDEIVARKDDYIAEFAQHRRETVHELADRDDVEFVHDTARFVDGHRIEVGDRTLEGDYIVIATGSRVHVPDMPGIDDIDYMTSADVLDATTLPDTGLVMGFGYVGLEMVPYLSEVGGMDLTVIEHDEAPLLDQADSAFGEALMDLYREEFDLEILTETREKSLELTDTGVQLRVEQNEDERTLEADQLFLFTGRRPAVNDLGLENTEIEPKEGWIAETMQTTADPRVYVVGDATGKEPLTHVAKEQAERAAANIRADIADGELEPWDSMTHRVMFSGLGVYPFARLGLTAEEAEEHGHDCVSVTHRVRDEGVFKIKHVPYGLAKLVVDADDGTVLGYQGLHHDADVMAKVMQVIIETGQDVRDLPARSFHPTTPEVLDGLIQEAREQVN